MTAPRRQENVGSADGKPGQRVGRQIVFREVNRAIERLNDDWRAGGLITFFCECGNDGCTEQVDLTAEQYLGVRLLVNCFVLTPGHDNPKSERIIETHPNYLLVQTLAETGTSPIKRDPRRRLHEPKGH